MKVDLETITDETREISLSGRETLLTEAVGRASLPEGVRVEPRVQGSVRIIPGDDEYYLVGTVVADVALVCARCLVGFRETRKLDLDFILRTGTPEQALAEGDEEASDVIFVQGGEVDIADLIVEELLLDIPMKPICRELCEGLCPTCGALKGSPECTCVPAEDIDPRWQALADLKSRMDE